MTASRALFFCSLAFIIGIFLASFWKESEPYFLIPLILGLSLAISFSSQRAIFLISFLFVFISLGGLWFNYFNQRESSFRGDFFRGVISVEPEIRRNTTHLVLSGRDEFKNEKVLVITERYTEYKYGDILEIEGQIEAPAAFNNFDYPGFLAKRGIYLTTFRPEIKKVGSLNLPLKRIIELKERIREYFSQGLPQPHAAIITAMTLGDRQTLSPLWREKMSDTGIGHIISVSGLHVTVITVIMIVFIGYLGIGKKKAIFILIPLLFFFILMTGLQAPAIRAGIMGGILIIANHFGRMNSALRAIVLAAALMLLVNPLLLKYDLGFQLSFLAMLGIIQLSPFFEKRLLFLPPMIRNSISMSFAAYLPLFPILIYHFQEISIIFPVTNLLVAPILYPMMILGAIFIFLSLFSSILATIALYPLWAFLTYLIQVVDFFSEIPWSAVVLGVMSSLTMLIYYLLIFSFPFLVKKKKML